jgi:predicted O-methyltransferase YrrM
LTGFSGLGLLEALPPNGTLWTFEKNPERAALAEKILAQGLTGNQKVHVLQGDAEQELQSIEKQGPFDGIFIDGNKLAYGAYLDWAELNLRPGGLILADNVFLSGAVYGEPVPHFSPKQIKSMQEFNQRLSDPTKYSSCLVPSFEGLFMSILLK